MAGFEQALRCEHARRLVFVRSARYEQARRHVPASRVLFRSQATGSLVMKLLGQLAIFAAHSAREQLALLGRQRARLLRFVHAALSSLSMRGLIGAAENSGTYSRSTSKSAVDPSGHRTRKTSGHVASQPSRSECT